MESPGYRSLLSHPQLSVVPLHTLPQICTRKYIPKSNESGTGGELEREETSLSDVHAHLSCQLWIWVFWARKWRAKHSEFRIHLKPVGLERAVMQGNCLSTFGAILHSGCPPRPKATLCDCPCKCVVACCDRKAHKRKTLRWHALMTDEKEQFETEKLDP